MSRNYQGDDSLILAIYDLVRVGVSGNHSGVKQLASRLLRSIPDEVGDKDSFRRNMAQALSQGIATASQRSVTSALPIATEQGGDLVSWIVPEDMPRPVHSPETDMMIDLLVTERLRIHDLVNEGIRPTSTLLFDGPPGVGKSYTAKWIAASMGLPLAVLSLSSLVSSLLGSTAKHLTSVFRFASENACVLFLDEFDAIARTRGGAHETGELRRLVNVILMELDQWKGESLLIAATNYQEIVDAAIERRFDQCWTFHLPTLEQRQKILEQLANQYDRTSSVDASLLFLAAKATDGESGSDLKRLFENTLRKSAVSGYAFEQLLAENILRANGDRKGVRSELWAYAVNTLGMSKRQVALLAGVTHPTVSSAICKQKES